MNAEKRAMFNEMVTDILTQDKPGMIQLWAEIYKMYHQKRISKSELNFHKEAIQTAWKKKFDTFVDLDNTIVSDNF